MIIGQLGRIPVLPVGSSAEAPVLVNDLWVLTLLGVGVVASMYARSLKFDAVGGLAMLFACLGGIMTLLAIPRFGLTGMDAVVSLAYLARWLAYFGIYLVVINDVRPVDVADVWHSLESMMLVFAAFGLLQAAFIPHFAQVVYPESRVGVDWDEQGHRLVSTVLEPNIAGAMIIVVLLIQLAQLSAGERVPIWKPTLLFAALAATLSRSSFLGLMVGAGIILAVRGISRRMVRFGILILVLLVPIIPRAVEFAEKYNKISVSDASAMSRVVSWVRVLSVWWDNKLFGIGFNTYRFVLPHYGYEAAAGVSGSSADGGLLFIALMTGAVGVGLYLGMLWLVIRRCRTVWRNPFAERSHQALATGIAAGTVAVCVHSFFVNSLLTPFVMEPLWVLWGLAFLIACDMPTVASPSPTASIAALGTAR
jgi:O-antigen ligase